MGLFSWCTSDTHKSIAVDMRGYEGCPKKVYLLNPFGEPYETDDYEGYGIFGKGDRQVDAYAEVAKWNLPKKEWEGLSDEKIRNLGIDIGCYPERISQLKYPIKIVENLCSYDDVEASPECPYQGYFYNPEECYDENDPDIAKAFEVLDGMIFDEKAVDEVLSGKIGFEETYNKAFDKERFALKLSEQMQPLPSKEDEKKLLMLLINGICDFEEINNRYVLTLCDYNGEKMSYQPEYEDFDKAVARLLVYCLNFNAEKHVQEKIREYNKTEKGSFDVDEFMAKTKSFRIQAELFKVKLDKVAYLLSLYIFKIS